MGYLYWSADQWGPIHLPILQAIANALGYFPGLDGKDPVAEDITEHEEIKLVFPWKLYPFWLTFMVPEGVMHATEVEK